MSYSYGRMNKHYRLGRGELDLKFDACDKNNKNCVTSDNIYYNVEILNRLTQTIPPNNPPFQNNSGPILAEYNENLTQPIIHNPSEYYLTIARFSIPGASIPIIDMDILPNQGNVNLTPYVLCLSYQPVPLGPVFPFATNLLYFSLNNNFPAPVPPSANPPTFSKVQSPYYYSYLYSTVIQMMNIALQTSFNALIAAFPGVPTLPTEAPFFIFDENTQLISLVAQNSYSQTINGAPTIQIFSNQLFYNRFIVSMAVQFVGNPLGGNPNGQDVLYLFPPMPIVNPFPNGPVIANLLPKYNDLYALSNAITPIAPGPPVTWLNRDYTQTINNPGLALLNSAYIFNVQQFIALEYWNSFKTIVFTSATLPIQAEYIPSSSTTISTNPGAIAYKPILTDFEPLLERAGDARTLLQYFPQGPYRLLSLLGSSPIQKIDLKIFWQDIYDILHPLMISENQSARVKLLFIKKEEFI